MTRHDLVYNRNMNDDHYLRLAMVRSQDSVQHGKFPAGALVVANYRGEPQQVSGISGNARDSVMPRCGPSTALLSWLSEK